MKHDRTSRVTTPLMAATAAVALLASGMAVADGRDGHDREGRACQGLPSHGKLTQKLKDAVDQLNGGFGLNMWATIVDRDGVVCAVTFSGEDRGDQWPGSRVISAQKANTANAFSLPGLALSTANLFSAVQPGGSLYGLQHSNPVDTTVAYSSNSSDIGTKEDPMTGFKIGGVNVFGGGVPLYKFNGGEAPILLGALGVSGDSSCADHNIAWRVRHALKLDHVPQGVNVYDDPLSNDGIIYDIDESGSASGWGHPECGNDEAVIWSTTVSELLPIME